MTVTLNIPKKSGKNGVASTEVTKKKSGAETVIESKSIKLPLQIIPDEFATVGINIGTTVNTGDYCNMKMGVHISVPCDVGDIGTAFDGCAKWVEERLSELHGKYIK